jgi:hypothetical protein
VPAGRWQGMNLPCAFPILRVLFGQGNSSIADIFFGNVVEEDMNPIRRDLKGLDNRIRHFLN